MSIASVKEARIPWWYNEEEKACFSKIKELGKKLGAKALVVEEKESLSVLLEFEEEISSDIMKEITGFNQEGHPLLITFVYEEEETEGERYGLQEKAF